MDLPELLDYAIRIPQGGNTGALTECTITWQMPAAKAGRNLRTRGVHANQVFAAIYATLRMLNTKLHSGV
jgi:D-citramalate synthase